MQNEPSGKTIDRKRARVWCVIAAGAGLIVGLVSGFLANEGTIKNANIFLRNGAVVSHVHLIDCHIIANQNAMQVSVENNRVTETRELAELP